MRDDVIHGFSDIDNSNTEESLSEVSNNEETIKIMILGNSSVGKTSFIIRFTKNKFDETYLATIGIDCIYRIINLENKLYKLMFYDTAGEEKYKSIPKNHIKNVQGVILMYDITNKLSFDSIIDWISDVKEIKGENFPMILVGNKIDLNESREVTEEMGNELAEKNQIEFFETSNKDGTNIQDAGLEIVYRILGETESVKANNSRIERISTANSNNCTSQKCC
jgi:small GTP-binding protein